LKEGIIRYFSLSKDDLVEEKLSVDKLKERALELHSDEEYPTVIFSDVEVNLNEEGGRYGRKLS
jgi:hypothetical protein